jgi:hypothetical protein
MRCVLEVSMSVSCMRCVLGVSMSMLSNVCCGTTGLPLSGLSLSKQGQSVHFGCHSFLLIPPYRSSTHTSSFTMAETLGPLKDPVLDIIPKALCSECGSPMGHCRVHEGSKTENAHHRGSIVQTVSIKLTISCKSLLTNPNHAVHWATLLENCVPYTSLQL